MPSRSTICCKSLAARILYLGLIIAPLCSRCARLGLLYIASPTKSRACEACIRANMRSSCRVLGVLLSNYRPTINI